VIDIAQLTAATLGDKNLEREILFMFSEQLEVLLARIEDAQPANIPLLTHTLVGSARGIGASKVALAAEALEGAGRGGDAAAFVLARRRLVEAVEELQAALALIEV
jgi:HPt (histidine-containing phosphotransfer) domain-containing protein